MSGEHLAGAGRFVVVNALSTGLVSLTARQKDVLHILHRLL